MGRMYHLKIHGLRDEMPSFQMRWLLVSGRVPPEIQRIETQNDAILEAGATFSKAHHFQYLLDLPPTQ